MICRSPPTSPPRLAHFAHAIAIMKQRTNGQSRPSSTRRAQLAPFTRAAPRRTAAFAPQRARPKWAALVLCLAQGCGAATGLEFGHTDEHSPLPRRALSAPANTADPNAIGPQQFSDPSDVAGGSAPTTPCDDEPSWVAGALDTSWQANTAPAWLSTDPEAARTLWSSFETEPRIAWLRLDDGRNAEPPERRSTPHDSQLDVGIDWRAWVGTHSVSSDYVLRAINQQMPSPNPGLDASDGSLAVSPDGNTLVSSRCAGGNASATAYDTETGHPSHELDVGDAACLTAFHVTSQRWFFGDRSGLRAAELPTGLGVAHLATPGPVGRIDSTTDGATIVLTWFDGNLIDIEPGVFSAAAMVLDGPRLEPVASLDVAGALMNTALDPPGSLAIPAAIHPVNAGVAYFDEREALRLASAPDYLHSQLIEAAPMLAAPEPGAPRGAALPVVLDFSPDGRYLLRVRGKQLAAYRCR